MVEVKYKERLGNNLFQYCLGRIISQQLGYRLQAGVIPHFPHTAMRIDGQDYSSYPSQTFTGQRIDLKSIFNDKTKRKIVLDGFFQRYEYYEEHKNLIRSWLAPGVKLVEPINADDILLCVRRTDCVPDYALPLSYYQEALARASYARVFICTDDVNDWFVRELQKRYNAIIWTRDIMDDFAFCMLFNKIVIANSTFHWWAAFLSQAQEIYFPEIWFRNCPDIDLRVSDESRYIYIKCSEKYRSTINDKIGQVSRGIKRKLRDVGIYL